MGIAGRIAKVCGVFAVTGGLLVGGLTLPASGNPETPVRYPSGSSATLANNLGFDTCTAPSLDKLGAWRGTSPYKVVNVYFGGANRGCRQSHLSKSWVRSVTTMGWKLLPTFVGYQPTCTLSAKTYRYGAATARARGAADADRAISRAKSLGILRGSALYADIEHYDRSVTSCRTAVRRYASAWTATLHRVGYLAGVYVHQNSGLRDLSASYYSPSYARPDAVWMARWDRSRSLSGWPRVADYKWAAHQRAKQYRGDHYETWGGARIHVDNDRIKAPLATVPRTFKVTSNVALNARNGPSTRYAVVRKYAPGSSVYVVCQARGKKIGTTKVWNRLSNGAWISDYYVSTPSDTGFTAAITRCMYPGQVTASYLNARKGPGTGYAKAGSALPRGALAYVVCQKRGSLVETTRIWNKLRDGRWVSDYYVSNRSNSGRSKPVPPCF